MFHLIVTYCILLQVRITQSIILRCTVLYTRNLLIYFVGFQLTTYHLYPGKVSRITDVRHARIIHIHIAVLNVYIYISALWCSQMVLSSQLSVHPLYTGYKLNPYGHNASLTQLQYM